MRKEARVSILSQKHLPLIPAICAFLRRSAVRRALVSISFEARRDRQNLTRVDLGRMRNAINLSVFLNRVFLMVLPALILGCASVDTVRDAPISAGEERVFDVGFARMDEVVATTLPLLGLDNIERQLDGSREIVFIGTHGVTPASWGEVVRVIVTEVGATRSSVKVYWRSKFRDGVITSAPDWYVEIFAAIEERLP